MLELKKNKMQTKLSIIPAGFNRNAVIQLGVNNK